MRGRLRARIVELREEERALGELRRQGRQPGLAAWRLLVEKELLEEILALLEREPALDQDLVDGAIDLGVERAARQLARRRAHGLRGYALTCERILGEVAGQVGRWLVEEEGQPARLRPDRPAWSALWEKVELLRQRHPVRWLLPELGGLEGAVWVLDPGTEKRSARVEDLSAMAEDPYDAEWLVGAMLLDVELGWCLRLDDGSHEGKARYWGPVAQPRKGRR